MSIFEKGTPLPVRMLAMAAQENHDGEEYDLLVEGAEMIRELGKIASSPECRVGYKYQTVEASIAAILNIIIDSTLRDPSTGAEEILERVAMMWGDMH